jgi:hypothetical protein
MAKYVTVVLDIPPEEWKFSGYANSVLTKLTNNAHVPNPTPSLAVYGGHVALLLKAEADVTSGVPGAVKACAAAKEKVKEDLNHLRDSVQLAVEALVGGTDLKGIEVIVESTGMRLKKLTPRAKYDYEACAARAATASPAQSVTVRRGELFIVFVDQEDDEQTRGLGIAGVLAQHMVRAGLFEPAFARPVDTGGLVVHRAADLAREHIGVDEGRASVPVRKRLGPRRIIHDQRHQALAGNIGDRLVGEGNDGLVPRRGGRRSRSAGDGQAEG